MLPEVAMTRYRAVARFANLATDLFVAQWRRLLEPTSAAAESRTTITCVVADDHPALVEALAVVLSSEGIDVVARAVDGADALKAIEELRPTTAVLDVVMPRTGGIEVARLASRSTPETAAILYTGHNERELLAEALDAGARGFILKESPISELLGAVRLVGAGGTYVDPALAPTLVRAGATGHPALSQREREILRHLADGQKNDEIAKELSISPDTVRTYIRRAMEKLEADTRTQAVAIALRESLIG
jgi:DNA-binding NarL/FixJ family response regulator